MAKPFFGIFVKTHINIEGEREIPCYYHDNSVEILLILIKKCLYTFLNPIKKITPCKKCVSF